MAPDSAAPWLRKTFELRARPRHAFVYVASAGYHDLFVNGRSVGDGVLVPSVSHLGKRVRYLTYDVTNLLTAGRNCLGLWIGNGWASHREFRLSEGAMVIAQLDAMHADGSVTTIGTDGSWKTHPSPITGIGRWEARQFGGERYDARMELPGWSAQSLNDASWQQVRSLEQQPQTLSAEMLEPNRRVHAIKPAGIEHLPDGSTRIDMGLSYTGWLEIQLKGPSGREISLEYSEREDQPITYGQRDLYICSGRDRTPFRNRFNYHAFRWVTVKGLAAAPQKADITGHMIRSGYDSAAEFSCSNELLNRIYRMMRWTYEALTLGGYVVDCPHRERLGYGGDAHATMETGMSQFHTAAFYTKWMEDWRDSQDSNGEMPHTAPQIRGGGGPAWGGISVVLPWEVYRRYGDRRILENSYPAIDRWLSFLEKQSRDGMLHPFTSMSTPGQPVWSFLGDWVPPGRGQGPRERVDEPTTLFFNNCYWILNLQIAANIADALGHRGDAARRRERAKEIAAKVHDRFYDASQASYANGEQPYLAFPLWIGMTPEKIRPDVLKTLVTTIVEKDQSHINSGMHGTWLLWRLLGGLGRDDLLLSMLSQKTYPGWGYMLDQGATTVWEEWKGANSRIHSTLMGAGHWFTEGIAGIQVDDAAPGYKRFMLRPAVVGDLGWAKASFRSPFGLIRSEWRLAEGRFKWAVTVPPNTTALAHVPATDAKEVTEGGTAVLKRKDVRFIHMLAGKTVFELQPGSYEFDCPATAIR
jgi:alpha-L-rhamnosidase